MLSIMSRYKWRQLGILTSEIAGHDDFVQAVRDQITAAKANGRYTVRLKISVRSPLSLPSKLQGRAPLPHCLLQKVLGESGSKQAGRRVVSRAK